MDTSGNKLLLKVRSQSTATQTLRYECIEYLYRSSTQLTAPQVKINFTLLQYRKVDAKTAIRALPGGTANYRNAPAVDYKRSSF